MIPDRPLAFGGSRLDRGANRRGDEAWLAALLAAPQTRFVQINADRTVVADGKLQTGRDARIRENYLLGIDAGGTAWFAGRSDATEDLRDLRGLAVEGLLPAIKDDSPDDLNLGGGTFQKGIGNVVRDNDERYPADWRLSKRGRKG